MHEHFNIENQAVIDAIINNKIYPDSLMNLYEDNITQANELREDFKERLGEGFFEEIFYVPKEHPSRKHTLFYELSYGHAGKLAGTGLHETHFKSAFLHPDFERAFSYINHYEPDENNLEEICHNVFPEFNIPGYKEVLPIRLASYFYPDQLLPIFKIDHLEQICNSFGFGINAETNGAKLYFLNSYLKNQMIELEDDNTIKMYICTQVHYTIELLNRINNDECYQKILYESKKVWIKTFYEKGREVLIELNNTR